MSFTSETSLIQYICEKCPVSISDGIPIGDDASAWKIQDGFLVSSVDTVYEERHFSFSWSAPEDVGIRAIETAASDIVAMGVPPRAALVALGVPASYDDNRLNGLVQGMGKSLSRLSMVLLGGDIIQTPEHFFVSVTVFGQTDTATKLYTRAGARAGDMLYLSGATGRAAAALELLEQQKEVSEALAQFHHAPVCRFDMLSQLHPDMSALIDISDGLFLDCSRIATASKVQCIIEKEALPLAPELMDNHRSLKSDVYHYIGSGGDDYQLLSTAPASVSLHESWVNIGQVVAGSGVYLNSNGLLDEVTSAGFDHFS